MEPDSDSDEESLPDDPDDLPEDFDEENIAFSGNGLG